MSPDGRCGRCRTRTLRFDGTIRAAPYKGTFAQLFRRFKYNRVEYLDAYFGTLMCDAMRLAPWCAEVEALIPVPCHWLRNITGGFYPTRVLASAVSRRLRLPLIPAVRRIRFDRHQVGLTFTERATNVIGAFDRDPGFGLEGACVCVVDDVMTSGATLNEVARVLRSSGASKIYNIVLARAGQPDVNQQYI